MTTPQSDALAAATVIAERLSDPDGVKSAAPDIQRAWPQSLAGGAVGIALLHLERARSGHGSWDTAHRWLTLAVQQPLSAGPNASLFFGVPALALVLHAADGRYQQTVARLDTSAIAVTEQRLHEAHARIDNGTRPRLAEFDLICGLSGLGAYHLRRHPDHDITRAVLSYFVRLVATPPPDGLPTWWTDVSLNGRRSPEFPGGHANFGMSHGIAAPLALLSLALRAGITVDGQAEAVDRICTVLDVWEQPLPSGSWWPGFITPDHVNRVNRPDRQRPSWCYGTPGVARALQLAGIATGNPARQHHAETAMLACLQDPNDLDTLTDLGLCHGTAGVLQTAWRMATDATTSHLVDELPSLAKRLLTRFGPDTEPHDPEFLDGAAGIALALHTAGTGSAPQTGWDSCLLIN